MRTTVSVDDDVLIAVKERARREHRSVGDVLSDLARQALTRQDDPGQPESGFHGFEPFPHRGGPISQSLVDQLREEEGV